ncbi:9630_t:CDS:2 [Funneliformis mosseae]|uniref:9630_t:CDS:1 n=1 Tax=Funneliformis mosseae TaxID=27381 RepID=A0A9N9FI14_FUNMO|nr:9630_t:CDS:2 [Funneliformis mosseae]
MRKIVIETPITEFLDERLLFYQIKVYRDDEFENVSSIDSKRFGKAKSAVVKEGGNSVILKRIDIENIDIRNYVQEIKLIKEAGSNNSVLEFYGVLKDRFEDDYHLVFESVDCRTLGQYLQFNELDWKQKVKIAYEIANALKFLHERNIIHKNLTTGNILYDNVNETIKLINYSIFERNSAPKKNNFINKLRFWKRDSESCRYPKEYDIYCLGSILFQLTQNVKSTFDGDWEKYLKYYPPENVQDKYKQICKDCCRKVSNDRPNIQEVVKNLYDALQSVNNVSSSQRMQSTLSVHSIHRSNTTRNKPSFIGSIRKKNKSSLNHKGPSHQETQNINVPPSKKSDAIPQPISYLTPEPDIVIPQSTSYTYTSPHNPIKPPPTYPRNLPAISSPLITQDFITEMYNEFYDKVANCKMELSNLNDAYILDYINKAGQSESKILEYIDAKQSFTINKVLLALFHQLGIGTPVNSRKAFELYKEASSKDTFAAYVAGECSLCGEGISKNMTEAYKFYEKSAQAAMEGCHFSQVQLGQAYELGSDIEKNDREAFKWFRMASDQNYDMGHYHLGRCYDFGIGTGIDWNKALEFYQKASVNGNTLAISAIRDIQSKMQRTDLFYW